MSLVQRLPAGVYDRQPADPGPGEHLWILTTAFRMSDEAARKLANGQDPGDILMDQENMIMAPQPGCYKCEEPFSRRVFFRKCTGSMDPL